MPLPQCATRETILRQEKSERALQDGHVCTMIRNESEGAVWDGCSLSHSCSPAVLDCVRRGDQCASEIAL